MNSLGRVRLDRSNVLLPVVFFLSPLTTSIAPRLTPFFGAVAGLTLIGSALRTGTQRRELLPRQPALAAWLLLAAYVFINATWSVDPLAGLGKAALLSALVLISFAAVKAAARLDQESLRGSAIAFAAGALIGACFIMVELLTRGIVTRTVVGWIPQLASPKHDQGLVITESPARKTVVSPGAMASFPFIPAPQTFIARVIVTFGQHIPRSSNASA